VQASPLIISLVSPNTLIATLSNLVRVSSSKEGGEEEEEEEHGLWYNSVVQ